MLAVPPLAGSATSSSRFWIVGSPCWIWKGARNYRGYGRCWNGTRVVTAHRFAYELIHGSNSLKGLCGCHRCDKPPCVNPDHVFPGTASDNSKDRGAKQRARALAKVTAEQVREIRTLAAQERRDTA